MLILSRRVNESINIGDKIEIAIIDLRGDQVKVGIKAPRDVKVYRQEVYNAIQQENLMASRAGTDLPTLVKLLPEENSKEKN